MTDRLYVEPIDLDLDGHPGAQLLLDWWQSQQAATGTKPRRQALDPAAFAHLVGAINLIEREADGRLRFRLRGERIFATEDAAGEPHYVDQLQPASYRDIVVRDYADAMASDAPVASRVTVAVEGHEPLSYRRLMLPLLGRTGVPDSLVMFNPDSLDAGHRHHAQKVFMALIRGARALTRESFVRP
jgi:hypothetical protein